MNTVLFLVALASAAMAQVTPFDATVTDPIIGFGAGVICGDVNNTLDLSASLIGPGCDPEPFVTLLPEGDCVDVMNLGGLNGGCELTFDDATAIGSEFNRTVWLATGTAGMIVVPDNATAYEASGATAFLGGLDFQDATFQTTFLTPGNVVGFVDAASSIDQKVLVRTDPVADDGDDVVAAQNFDYTFSVDACSEGGDATLTAIITDNVDVSTGIAGSGPAAPAEFTVTETLNADATGNGTCATLSVTVPHYNLFAHLGVNGFTVRLAAATGRVFFANPQVVPTLRVDVADDSTCSDIFISEVSYIESTVGELEKIEIVGPPGTPLVDFQLELVDFDVDPTGNTYLTVSFDTGMTTPVLLPSSTTSNSGQFGFFVVEFPSEIQDAEGFVGTDAIRLTQGGVTLQFLCYGPNVTTAMISECDNAVDADGLAQIDNNIGSIQLFGCGFCREHFDYKLDNTTSFGGENPNHQFCRDADFDGFWDGNSTQAFNQAGLNKTAGEGVSCCGGNDCQNFYAHIFPGADEICDGFDSNCDGGADDLVDEIDADGDGRLLCDGDCNDEEATVFGDSEFVTLNIFGVAGDANKELCDSLDNNCNFQINEDFGNNVIHFIDEDGDGYAAVGLLENETNAFEFPNCMLINETDCSTIFPVLFGVAYAQQRLDCNDTDFDQRPDGFGSQFIQFPNGTDVPDGFCNRAELCDGADQNCNEIIDEGVYQDNDGDGFDTLNSTECQESGFYPLDTLGVDCDDTNNLTFPNATEICDLQDNDCDLIIDNGPLAFPDEDGDGFSSANNTECLPFYAERVIGTDCDDNNTDINPDAREVLCDGIDNDCRDTFPDLGIASPDNTTEICDGLDNNCDGEIDEDFVADNDGDGFVGFISDIAELNCTGALNLSDPNPPFALTAPESFQTNDPNPPLIYTIVDCNDAENRTFPGNTEVCDGIDNNCADGVDAASAVDGVSGFSVDEGLIFDDDNDGRLRYENSTDVAANPTRISPNECFVGDGMARKRQVTLTFPYDSDCNDGSDTLTTFGDVNTDTVPFTEASCNQIDDNCDGFVDEELFLDADEDGFSSPDSTGTDCASPATGTAYDVANIGTDCNDGVFAINPDAFDIPCDNIDNDCNATTGAGNGGEDDFVALTEDKDDDGFRVGINAQAEIDCAAVFTDIVYDCDDETAARRPCNSEDTLGENGECLRELEFRGDGFGDDIDNDCNDLVDDIIKDTIELSLSGEIVEVTSTVGDDDSDDSTSDSSNDDDDDDCTDVVIAVTLEVRSKFDDIVATNVIVKGHLSLPPRAVVDDYVFGDLSNFGVKIDRNSNRVTWVQFELNRQQQIHIPICLRRSSDAPDVALTLAVTSVDQDEVVPANTLSI